MEKITKVILIVSVEDAADKGIKIYTIGLGSPDGVPIPVYDNRGNQSWIQAR